MLLASIAGVTLQMKIRHVSAWLLLFLTDAVCILLAGGFLLAQGVEEKATPRGWDWGVILLRGLIVAVGAYCFFAAFNHDGGMMSILTLFSLAPICAALLLALLGGGWPTLRQWIGAALAIFAVWLVVGGVKQLPP
ncbi:EamA family transporter [Candidatus Peregrinibacteria bacterium]|nr:EamA family transporter [Candidatus Peregrinibacteria bacterium]